MPVRGAARGSGAHPDSLSARQVHAAAAPLAPPGAVRRMRECCRSSCRALYRAPDSVQDRAQASQPARLRGKVLQHGGEQAVHGAPARVAPVVLGHLAARRQERGHRRRLAPARPRSAACTMGPPVPCLLRHPAAQVWEPVTQGSCRTGRLAAHSSRCAWLGSEPLPPAARARQARCAAALQHRSRRALLARPVAPHD